MNEKIIKKAIDFIEESYKMEYLCGTYTYFHYVMGVYKMLLELKIEDTNTYLLVLFQYAKKFNLLNDIKNEFGLDIYNMICEFEKLDVEKYNNMPNSADLDLDIVFAFISDISNIRFILVILANNLFRLKTSFSLSVKERIHLAQKANSFYVPLCRVLGISKFTTLFDDYSFKVLHPGAYYNASKAINDLKRSYYKKHLDFTAYVKAILSENIGDFVFEHRTKGVSSLHRKYSRYLNSNRIQQGEYHKVLDIFAFRIIVPKVEDCYKVENLLSLSFTNIPDKRDDYIKKPRPTGYKSIHQIYEIYKGIFVEVQIKTFYMHDNNEFGYASHAAYKFKKSLSGLLKEKPLLLKELNYVNMFNEKLPPFSDYVYVFTPKGDVKRLRKGATPVDFAYLIHSSVGDRCFGAYVNNRLVPLNYQLKNGDTVKIRLTSKSKLPSSDWLDFVVEKRTKHLIKKRLLID